uniref:Uncharacterized protein n=1 Tax=Arundo donax TaxID=35708 RepID=A0A0A8YIV1_ARUDO
MALQQNHWNYVIFRKAQTGCELDFCPSFSVG